MHASHANLPGELGYKQLLMMTKHNLKSFLNSFVTTTLMSKSSILDYP
jgi:hypothetical protein